MTMFIPDDKIRCISVDGNPFIEVGKIYTFMKYKDDGRDNDHPQKLVFLKENYNHKYTCGMAFWQKRFKKVLNKSPEEWL